MTAEKNTLDLLLGKKTEYTAQYSPDLLCAIPREPQWKERGFAAAPFSGVDIWNAYEISWLNGKGKPQVAVAEFQVPFDSPNLIESKSFKLYLNSFAQSSYESVQGLTDVMQNDLSDCAGASVIVKLTGLEEARSVIEEFEGINLDTHDIHIDVYQPEPALLQCQSESTVNEALYSHLLRSLCPVTGQPDWGSLYVEYSGSQIDHTALLRYIISYREHAGFHEQCVESMFLDIFERCRPDELTVYARYQRRGGLDINPYRTNTGNEPKNLRLCRQ